MLILSRKLNEKIHIGDDSEIVICGIAGGRVQVGVVAPKELKVLRSEAVKQTRGGDVQKTNCEVDANG